MKKNILNIFTTLVTLIYVFSTIGVSVIKHYCGEDLEKISIYSKPTSCCDDKESGIENSDCCKNESVYVVFQKDFTFYTLVKNIKAPVNEFFVLNIESKLNIVRNSLSYFLSSDKKNHPPNLVQQDIVSSSVIRI